MQSDYVELVWHLLDKDFTLLKSEKEFEKLSNWKTHYIKFGCFEIGMDSLDMI